MSFIIKFKSCDGMEFPIDTTVASNCGLVKKMMDIIPVTQDGETFIFPTIKSGPMSKIVAWAKYHTENPNPSEPLEKRPGDKVAILSWDAELMKDLDLKGLYNMSVAAIQLQIMDLIALCGYATMNKIHGMTALDFVAIERAEEAKERKKALDWLREAFGSDIEDDDVHPE